MGKTKKRPGVSPRRQGLTPWFYFSTRPAGSVEDYLWMEKRYNKDMTLLLPIICWTATLAWAGVIFYFSSMNGSNVPSVLPDYIPHFAEYAIFAFLLYSAIRITKKQMPAGLVGLWAICLVSIYAAFDEFHQSFVPGRSPDVKDWAVDVLASVIVSALLVYLKFDSHARKRA